METLRQKQSRFARMISELIQKATDMGYEVTFGEAYRSPEEAARLASAGKGIAQSLHCERLAIDLNLFKDGVFLATSEAHTPIGVVWEQMGGSWGGRFKDGNHYSLAHNGRK
jgi:hypothetical protein